ncbi:MAG: binding-protein-dependent transport system inner rane component [Chloroflexi bacterium]|nr:binding-protein-dependent transport system inner rane component [Chloroflexota bacterium]
MTAAAPAAAVKPRRRWAGLAGGGGGGRVSRVAYLYLVPAFLVMGIITLYPLLYQVWMSFTDYGVQNLRETAPPPAWVGLDNYVNVLTSALAIPNFDFLRIILYNLVWAFSNVIIHVVLGVAIAVLLNTRGLWFRRFYRAMYILPVVIPPIIVATVWRAMYDAQDGAVNLMLSGVGVLFRIPPDFFQIDWLRQVEDPIAFIPLPLAFYAMLITNTWLGWPLNAVVATGALQSIPNELYEAAEIDGASSWQKFRNITMAYLRPAMLPYAIYGFVITFNLFHLSYFMSQGGPFGRTEQLVTQAYRLVNEQQLYGVGAAFCVIMFFILLAITLVTNWLTKATATYNL